MQRERLSRRNSEILGSNACSGECSSEGKKRWSACGCEVRGREIAGLAQRERVGALEVE